MMWMKKLQERLKGLTDAITRFPLTTVFLLAAAVINANDIATESDPFSRYMLACIVGAFLSAVAQVASERFSSKISGRMALMGTAILLAAGYYLIIMYAPELSMEMIIRTVVALFALLFAFIWVPVIKSEISFNKSFMISFKSLFNSLFFSGVIFAGISIILTATNELIFEIDSRAYSHSSNIIFVIFAPMYYLSLIPVFLGIKDRTPEAIDNKKRKIDHAAKCPKFLEVLVSYILIPLIAVFTLILVVYIIKNVGGDFWKDNLLEPMLVSYSITVILIYILASELENKFTSLFRLIFPKLLVPIVLFQLTSSVLVMNDTGVTHNRYFVILFGVFAAIVGLLLSFLSVRKNGLIAALLILFATVAIVPPVDAFTVSKNSQINRIEAVLEKNNMLEDGSIKPNSSISNEDKRIITDAMQYLAHMEYTDDVKWLPKNFDAYRDFHSTFGFGEYYGKEDLYNPIYLMIEQPLQIKIKGFDMLVQTNISVSTVNEKIIDLKKDGKQYTLSKELTGDNMFLVLKGEDGKELISFDTQTIFERYSDYTEAKAILKVEEATFTEENETAKLEIIVQDLDFDKQNKEHRNATIYVLMQIK